MQTSAPSLQMQYTGMLCAPLEIRATSGEGHHHTIVLRMHPSKSGLHELVAHVPIQPGPAALKEAEHMVARINAAQKHGKNALTLSAPLARHTLICQAARIDAHESDHPSSAAPEKAPEIEKVADLFAEAA